MNQNAIDRMGPLAASRSSALLTQEDMAKRVGVSVKTLLKMEKNPNDATHNLVGIYYQNVGMDGKKILQDYYNFFDAT